MKNYNEMAKDVFRRIEEHETEQRNRRKTISRIITPLCCFCLVALLGFGMWQGGVFNITPSDQTLEDALYPGIKDNFDESKGEFPSNPAANNKIVINSINGISADKMMVNLAVGDCIEMTMEELCEYYGVDYIPDVPIDIKIWPDQIGEIFKRNGGTGEVYWDANGVNFSNEDFTRTVHVEVDKGSYVLQDYLYFKGTEEKSLINNTEVLIGLTENGYYYSEFMYNGIGFLIDAKGVTEDEFISIIQSIIK